MVLVCNSMMSQNIIITLTKRQKLHHVNLNLINVNHKRAKSIASISKVQNTLLQCVHVAFLLPLLSALFPWLDKSKYFFPPSSITIFFKVDELIVCFALLVKCASEKGGGALNWILGCRLRDRPTCPIVSCWWGVGPCTSGWGVSNHLTVVTWLSWVAISISSPTSCISTSWMIFGGASCQIKNN